MYIQSILNHTRNYCHQAYNSKHGNANFQAPRPCDRCRKHRIKCDRSLLGCSHCTKNSTLCEYKYIPKKRGPKSKLERDCNYLRSFNKKYISSIQAHMPSPDPSTICSTGNDTQLGNCTYTPIQQFSQADQFGYEGINLSLSTPPPIPPILISQYFPQLHNPHSLNATTPGSSDYTQELNNMPLIPSSQGLSVAFSPNPQESFLQKTTTFNSSTQDLSLSISPELNQYIFETPVHSQDAFQTPPTTLIDSYTAPIESLSPSYWLPIPSICFTSVAGYSTKSFHPRPELSPMTL